ncbi:hypothetical protein CMUS01_07311 [Colletotrichum musicola]|uniref:Uncharacterized protein n=1 Tax=Colletotrichum musicola TaxID=2175873 RepID=A0A8H6NG11_9PEZI|nr:hypothetical protein CMUS01_07311 [Colletotrichum musicola]
MQCIAWLESQDRDWYTSITGRSPELTGAGVVLDCRRSVLAARDVRVRCEGVRMRTRTRTRRTAKTTRARIGQDPRSAAATGVWDCARSPLPAPRSPLPAARLPSPWKNKGVVAFITLLLSFAGPIPSRTWHESPRRRGVHAVQSVTCVPVPIAIAFIQAKASSSLHNVPVVPDWKRIAPALPSPANPAFFAFAVFFPQRTRPASLSRGGTATNQIRPGQDVDPALGHGNRGPAREDLEETQMDIWNSQ